ncbi:hypothetical protein ABH922_000846 [Rhodococcus sp. 27YEA15]|uniref:C40 family peptidase n=1 Tax=Rhodococcus sp. 27YEA15 TaxID=3156259 RepID=UPI003C7ECF35
MAVRVLAITAIGTALGVLGATLAVTSFAEPAPDVSFAASSSPLRAQDGSGAVVPSVPSNFPGSALAPVGAVAVFAPWVKKAGALCPEITPPMIASLYSGENGFEYGPASAETTDGRRGPGRFTTAEWTAYGRDGDGDGKMDIFGVADPVMTTGYRLCELVGQARNWLNSGEADGDVADLALAAYDVGPDAVRAAHRVPADQAVQYVARIRSLQDSFALMLTPFDYNTLAGAVGGVVQAGLKFLGLPYVWGGGNVNGPSMGGFDCSGLTSYAMYAATGITLPRTSETQWGVGVEIPLDQAQPGDLLFGNWQAGGPGHVAIYVGNGQMLHAPTFGDVVKVGPIFAGMKARRVL